MSKTPKTPEDEQGEPTEEMPVTPDGEEPEDEPGQPESLTPGRQDQPKPVELPV